MEVEAKIPVLGGAQNGSFSTKGGFWVNEFERGEGASALFALISEGFPVATFWAGAGNIAVGQELMIRGIVVLLDYPFFKLVPLFVEIEKKVLRSLVV